MQMNNVPIGWSFKRVQDMGRVITGSTPPMSDKDNYGNEFCWATAQDFKSKYIDDTVVKLSSKGKTLSRVLPAGSVLVTCIASIGLNAIAKTEMATNQQINAIIPNDDFCSDFLYYLFCYNTDKLKQYAGSGGILILSKGEFEKIRFMLPPIKEQEKIAEVLGTWDRAIEELTGLIAEKKELKRGLMQRLLTGAQRLPGFTKTWKETKLHDVAEISKGTQLNRLNMLEEGYPVYNGGMIESGFTNEYNNGADTIIISEGGNSCGFVNFIKTKFWAGGHCYTVFCRDCVNKSFLYQLLKYNENKLMNLRVGSGLPNIQQKALNKFPLLLPNDLAEQKAIADILSKADSEIDLLNQQLDVLREQKRGLMQKLLTGEIRVKVDTDEQ